MGVVILVYGPAEDVMSSGDDFETTVAHAALRQDIEFVTDVKLTAMKESGLYMTLGQFDGGRYPSPQATDNRYKTEDERYELMDKEL